MAADDYSPRYVGDTLKPLVAQFNYKDGTPIPLASATLALVMESGATRRTGTGTWAITGDGSAGQATYAFSDTDVGTVGDWLLQAAITIAGKTEHTDTKLLQIIATL